MKKSKSIFGAVVLIALLIYFRPLPFPDLFYEADSDAFSVTKTDILIEHGSSNMISTVYSIQKGSPEAAAIQDILDRYSYRRSLKSLFRGNSLSGNEAGYWLHFWGPNIDLDSGGTGEIRMGDRVYRMGWFGNKQNLAFMGEISAVLAEAEPISTS